jgi:hypothetical protein
VKLGQLEPYSELGNDHNQEDGIKSRLQYSTGSKISLFESKNMGSVASCSFFVLVGENRTPSAENPA